LLINSNTPFTIDQKALSGLLKPIRPRFVNLI
jgi:hypothetical protein